MLALGAGVAVGTAFLPAQGGYARIGPNFVPVLVAFGLLLVGAALLYEALTGGWRRMPQAPAGHRFHRGAFGWISAGLLAHMALIAPAGFILAGGALFTCVARGFGSVRFVRDAAVGLALASAVYLFFTRFLNVSLP